MGLGSLWEKHCKRKALSLDWQKLQRADTTQIFHQENNWGSIENTFENTLIEGAWISSITETEQWGEAILLSKKFNRRLSSLIFQIKGRHLSIYLFLGLRQSMVICRLCGKNLAPDTSHLHFFNFFLQHIDSLRATQGKYETYVNTCTYGSNRLLSSLS